MSHLDITTDEQLREYCPRLAEATTIGFDTEFVSEHTYRSRLCLVQIVADGQPAMIDAMTIEDMTPFWEVIARPGHETIVHAGRGEVEFCLHAVGRPPAGMVDVQIAAGLVGIEYPVGYGALISKLLGESPGKHETRTDWRRRPLSRRQIEYAIEDALYLQPLRDKLYQRLESLGRLGWLREEMQSWQEEVRRTLFHERWRRVSGNSGLDARAMAILRELWQWREQEAERRDMPVRRVLRDDLMVEMARRKTAEIKRIGAVRGLERGDLRRRLPEIAAAIARALALPDEECPERHRRDQVPAFSVLGQFLFSALGSICRDAHLAPGLVGTPGDIREWMAYRGGDRQSTDRPPPALARGWRAEVVGNLFDDLLSGKVAIRIRDSRSDHPLSFERSEPGP
ncbi:MAG: HRDC domain-containing protein [Planctomycetia bacterium]|nr:HRDC domain-containing protein [Planctomycetia bacterium]